MDLLLLLIGREGVRRRGALLQICWKEDLFLEYKNSEQNSKFNFLNIKYFCAEKFLSLTERNQVLCGVSMHHSCPLPAMQLNHLSTTLLLSTS